MSYTVLGNNSNPLNNCLIEQYYEEDDENIIYMQGELVEEEDTVGYRATTPKGSSSTTVELGYYYRRPTSEWYWDYAWDENCKPVIPLVFACNSNWTITECLNASFTEYPLANRNNGWLTVNLTLTRKLNKNEKIFFGFYSDLHTPVWSTQVVNNCWYNYSHARRSQYNSAVAYVSSAAYISQNNWWPPDYNFCVYLKYEDATESVAYTRSISAGVGVSTASSRKTIWKRTLNPSGNIISVLNRKSDWKRPVISSGNITGVPSRKLGLFWSISDSKNIEDTAGTSIKFFRNLENQSNIQSQSQRACTKRISKEDSFSFTDSMQQLFLIIRSIFSISNPEDNHSKVLDYKREQQSFFDDEEIITRCGENYRSFTDEIDFMALSFASRLFFRTVQTVMSVWDWIRGKIREANNVITLFCPGDMEIELECKI